MKGKLFSLAILVMVLALAFIGCSNESGSETQTETWNTVTDEYPVLNNAGVPDLTVAATQSSLTGEIRLTVTGTISDTYSYIKKEGSTTSWWDIHYAIFPEFTPADGVYGALVLDEFFPENASERVLAVKITNDAFRYYTDGVGNASAPLDEPVAQNQGSIHIPTTGTATRWRLYNTFAADSANYIPDDDYLSILLWSGANPKTIEIQLQEFSEFDVDADYTVLKTITIDYSGVEFKTDVATSYDNTASTSDYVNDLEISSAIRNDVTGVTTIALSGTTANALGGPSTWWDGVYHNPISTAEAGEYAAFIFDGAFPADAVSKRIAIYNENDALRLYTAVDADISDTPLVSPVIGSSNANIYIPALGAGTAVKWRLYNVGDIPDGDWLAVLLWSGASSKVAKFEIQVFDAGYTPNPSVAPVKGTDYTVTNIIVIDYSNVMITAAAE
jgi:hypothetical protein